MRHERHRDRRDEPDEVRREEPPPQPGAHAVLALQRAIGNHGTARVLARERDKNRPNFPNSVKVGKLGPIEIKGGNIAEWAAKQTPDDLHVISAEGAHSAELKRLFETKAKIDAIETSSVVGENTIVTIAFSGCRIRRYSSDGETEEWRVEYQGAKRQTLSIGSARP
jgi:hypothetical protein